MAPLRISHFFYFTVGQYGLMDPVLHETRLDGTIVDDDGKDHTWTYNENFSKEMRAWFKSHTFDPLKILDRYDEIHFPPSEECAVPV